MPIASTLAGLTILIIGDSHLATQGYLVTTLQDDLLQQGAKVESIGICGVQPADWVKQTAGSCGGATRDGKGPVKMLTGPAAHTTPVTDLIQEKKPDMVLVVIGDTIAAYKQNDFPQTWAWQQVRRLTGAISKTGVGCAWVGPAWGTPGGKYGKNYDRVKVVNDFLSKNVAPCTYIDSTAMSKQGEWATIDGQHFTGPGYKAWGDAIAQAMAKLPAGDVHKVANK